jgi:Ni/Co efflux regulator RcnB
MKKVLLALAAAVVTVGAVAPAYADAPRHHRECHKVKVHQHWVNRCH